MKPKVEVQLTTGKVHKLRVNNVRGIERMLRQKTGDGKCVLVSRVPGGKRLPLRLSVLDPRLRGIGEKGAPLYARFWAGDEDADEEDEEEEDEDEEDEEEEDEDEDEDEDEEDEDGDDDEDEEEDDGEDWATVQSVSSNESFALLERMLGSPKFASTVSNKELVDEHLPEVALILQNKDNRAAFANIYDADVNPFERILKVLVAHNAGAVAKRRAGVTEAKDRVARAKAAKKAPKKSPKKASPKKASPKKASPKKSPKKASPRSRR